MTRYWYKLLDAYEGLGLRERILVLGGCIAFLYGSWNGLLFQPLATRYQALGDEFTGTREQLLGLQRASQEVMRPYANDPNQTLERERAQLEGQIAVLDDRLNESVVSLIPPEDMARVLEGLLDGHRDLELVRLESLGAVPLHAEGAETPESGGESRSRLFRHGLLIELEGTYLSALRYLQRAEDLPWRFFWDRLDYRVVEYPRARLQIELHTLSGEEAWIGV